MPGALHVHGVVEKGARHMDNAPPHWIASFHDFDAVVSDYTLCADTANVPQDVLAAAAMDYHQILLAYCRDFTLLPLRFGAVFSGEKALAAAMRRHQKEYAEALATIGDRREYTVELIAKTSEVLPLAPPKSGRAFLSNRKELRDRHQSVSRDRQSFVKELCEQLAAISAMPPHRRMTKQDKALDISVLLSPAATSRLSHMATEIEALAAKLGLCLCIKGPWPAYHFAWSDEERGARYGS